MPVTINGTPAAAAPSLTTSTTPAPTTKPKRLGGGHQRPAAYLPPLDVDESRIRVSHWLALLGGLSASAFYARLDRGWIPEPCGKDPRPFWRARVVREFLAK